MQQINEISDIKHTYAVFYCQLRKIVDVDFGHNNFAFLSSD